MSSSPSMSFVVAKRGGMPARWAWSMMRWTTAWMQRWTGLSSEQKSQTLGNSFRAAVSMARSRNSAMPSPLTALMGTTGMPSASLSFWTSMVPPLARTSSIMFSASTMGTRSSRSWSVR